MLANKTLGKDEIWRDDNFFTQYSKTGTAELTGAYCHQGFTKDENGNFYFVDSVIIKKYNPANDTELASGHPASGLSGNHYGDPKYYDGFLYVPYETYASGDSSDQALVKVNPSTLAIVDSISLDESIEVSGVTIANEIAYITSFNGQGIQIVNLQMGFYDGCQRMGFMDLDFFPIRCQGIDILGNKMIIHAENRVFMYEMLSQTKAKLIGCIHNGDAGGTEGIFFQDENTIITHKDTGGGTCTMYTIDITAMDFYAPIDFENINMDVYNKSFGTKLAGQSFEITMDVRMPTLYNWVHLWECYHHNQKNKAWVYSSGIFGYRFGDQTSSSTISASISANTWFPVRVTCVTDTYGKTTFSASINSVDGLDVVVSSGNIDILFFGGGLNLLGVFEMRDFNIEYK